MTRKKTEKKNLIIALNVFYSKKVEKICPNYVSNLKAKKKDSLKTLSRPRTVVILSNGFGQLKDDSYLTDFGHL